MFDLGRGDHVLGQLVADGFDADGGIAHGWLVHMVEKPEERVKDVQEET